MCPIIMELSPLDDNLLIFSCYVLLSFIVSDHIVYVILHVSATHSALLKHFIVKTFLL